MTNSTLYEILVDYIEQNKVQYDIDYNATIDNLKELLEEIEQDYEEMEEEECTN